MPVWKVENSFLEKFHDRRTAITAHKKQNYKSIIGICYDEISKMFPFLLQKLRRNTFWWVLLNLIIQKNQILEIIVKFSFSGSRSSLKQSPCFTLSPKAIPQRTEPHVRQNDTRREPGDSPFNTRFTPEQHEIHHATNPGWCRWAQPCPPHFSLPDRPALTTRLPILTRRHRKP